jgi:TolA-binding protein
VVLLQTQVNPSLIVRIGDDDSPVNLYNVWLMADPQLIHQLQDRVERLLLRHEELRRANDLLMQQNAQLTQERDTFKQRLQSARQRVDALMNNLPNQEESAP